MTNLNPYDSPGEDSVGQTRRWRPSRTYLIVNLILFGILGANVLIHILYGLYSLIQMERSLGRRYATYDSEYEVWVDAPFVIGLLLFFAIPNSVVFVVQYLRKRHQRGSWKLSEKGARPSPGNR